MRSKSIKDSLSFPRLKPKFLFSEESLCPKEARPVDTEREVSCTWDPCGSESVRANCRVLEAALAPGRGSLDFRFACSRIRRRRLGSSAAALALPRSADRLLASECLAREFGPMRLRLFSFDENCWAGSGSLPRLDRDANGRPLKLSASVDLLSRFASISLWRALSEMVGAAASFSRMMDAADGGSLLLRERIIVEIILRDE